MGTVFSRSAYFHAVLINACNFLVECSCVGTDVHFRPRGSFSTNFCPMFIAFLQLEIQSVID